MQELAALFGIATALSIGAVSPGPSFVMVARTAVSSSRINGMYAALGMGVGGLIFAIASLLGLQGLLLAVPSLYWAIKVAGGLYLACLGLRIWLCAKKPLMSGSIALNSSDASVTRSFILGLTTQISNPKTAIIYASVFAAFLPAATSLPFKVGAAGIVFCIEAGWYTVVALALSSYGSRNTYCVTKPG